MSQKKILVLGATGAMGQYLVPKLAERGYLVDAVSLDECPFRHANVNVITGNSKEYSFRTELLKNNYDAIVDFMIYKTPEFQERYKTTPEHIHEINKQYRKKFISNIHCRRLERRSCSLRNYWF